ncbi:MAG: DUF4159 domain-containing protein [Acidobacteria bacterium]|nr:DUF4159 domain-containing protein [Acidobacteriota bacterium]
MSSASRNVMAAVTLVALAGGALLALSTVASAKVEQDFRDFQRGRRLAPMMEETTAEYDGRFAFMRLRYGAADLRQMRREPPWAHDFPRAEFHFMKILSELTFTRTWVDQGNIRSLDDPAMAMFPVAYMSEPGFWTLNAAEADGLRGYLQKGGFIIFDDFRENHRDNLVSQMRRVLPDARWVVLDVTHPIFHSFFEIDSLDVEGYYGPTEWTGIFEDNDPTRRLLAVANYNHDLGEMWEFSDTGYMPVDLSNEAYKFGVNYVIYAMTH